MEKNQSKSRIFGLDIMRSSAILMVLFGHCLLIYPPSSNLIYQSGLYFGFLGVEVFFVLSGFLIGKILYQLYVKEDFSFQSVKEFVKRRWYRTLPNYYLVLLINILISFIIGFSIVEGWKYFFFLQNFNTTLLPFFPESWSLSIEEFAYIILPITLLTKTLIVKPKNKSLFFLIIIASLIVFFLLTKIIYAFTTSNTTIEQWNVSLKAVVIYRLDAIFIGVLMSWIYLNFYQFWKKIKFISAFLGLILLGFLFIGIGFFQLTFDYFPSFWNFFYLPITSIMCALFLPFLSEWKTTSNAFIHTIITHTSKISYSIYLLHYSVILQLALFYLNKDDFSNNQLHLFTVGYLIVTFVLSSLLYKYFEKPMMDLRDKKVK